MSEANLPTPRGRGAAINPPNRFGGPSYELELEHVEHDEEFLASLEKPATEYLPDHSRTIVAENDSPDVGFRYSINPYRGCSHGCAYCYARPYHEYLGLSAGLDFETKIFVKFDAPVLFREFLCRESWQPESIALSGVTDCYQPAERRFQLTRQCLEVAVEARQPMSIITKNALVVRDLDLLRELAAHRLLHVNMSLTTLDAELARTMEPRTSTPLARLRAIRALADAGVPVRALIAPVIPGLNDNEIPRLLAEAKEAGAMGAGYILLRLPLTVRPVFLDWLDRTQPTRKERVVSRIRSTRAGALNNAQFGQRMRGEGPLAEQINRVFHVFVRKHGLDGPLPAYDASQFRPPRPRSGQLRLF